MSPQANCFQIKGSEIILGLPPTSDVLEGVSLPWGESWGESVDPNGPRCNWVKYNFHEKSGNHHITGGHLHFDIDPRAGHIFYFDVPDLHFGGGPLLEGLNLWPGGEWHNVKPLWRQAQQATNPRMTRHILQRAEIWTVKTFQSLLLVDQFGGVRTLNFVYGQWLLLPVDMEEMVQYLSTRGLAMTTHKGIMWSLKNLEMICKVYPEQAFINATHGVREHLARLQS